MQMLGYKANLTKSAFLSLCQMNFYKIWNMHGVSYFSVCEPKIPTQFSRAASQSYSRETTKIQTVLFFSLFFHIVIFPSGRHLYVTSMIHEAYCSFSNYIAWVLIIILFSRRRRKIYPTNYQAFKQEDFWTFVLNFWDIHCDHKVSGNLNRRQVNELKFGSLMINPDYQLNPTSQFDK